MMSLLIPLGLLGLLSIIALIVIYIIKPNFQQKMISSSFVWKLSLRFKKKDIPINRFRNILIFLCQLLILASCAVLLAQPAIVTEYYSDDSEKIVLIDASASMRAEVGLITRFERAVEMVKTDVRETMMSGGVVSVILVDDSPSFVTRRADQTSMAEVMYDLDDLIQIGDLRCSYGSADIDNATVLVESVLQENPECQVLYYTATQYLNAGDFTIVDVSEGYREFEWNAAILNCTAELDLNNYYSIAIDVGCYGRSAEITVTCRVVGGNYDYGYDRTLTRTVLFDESEPEQTIVFSSGDQLALTGDSLYAFDYLHVSIDSEDSLYDDNTFYLYGGIKEGINVQYASTLANNYFSTGLYTLRRTLRNRFALNVDEVRNVDEYAKDGMDLYIFEHTMPESLPYDGVCVLVNPDRAPIDSGITLGSLVEVDETSTLTSGEEHAIMRNVHPDSITIATYRQILSYDSSYTPVMYFNDQPVMLVRDENGKKTVVLTINLNYSNLAMLLDFPQLLLNIFNYYIPSTITSHSFEIGDTVSLNARGDVLSLTGPGVQTSYTTFPAQITVTAPGAYTLTQESMRGDLITENFYVKMPNSESNILRQMDSLPTLPIETLSEEGREDLLIYFAAALVALLFVEWWLQSREYF